MYGVWYGWYACHVSYDFNIQRCSQTKVLCLFRWNFCSTFSPVSRDALHFPFFRVAKQFQLMVNSHEHCSHSCRNTIAAAWFVSLPMRADIDASLIISWLQWTENVGSWSYATHASHMHKHFRVLPAANTHITTPQYEAHILANCQSCVHTHTHTRPGSILLLSFVIIRLTVFLKVLAVEMDYRNNFPNPALIVSWCAHLLTFWSNSFESHHSQRALVQMSWCSHETYATANQNEIKRIDWSPNCVRLALIDFNRAIHTLFSRYTI